MNIYETFGQQKIDIWSTEKFPVECCFCAWLGNRSKFEDIAFRQLLALDHQTLHRGEHWYTETALFDTFGFWEQKYREMEFQPFGSESSPFCRTKWFHIHKKIAIFHQSVWLRLFQLAFFVAVVGSSAVDAGSFSGSPQLRQKSH